ncbi:MAG: phosphatidylglycerol lysyltransferase domain-containing protein [Blastocatellia bacterium]
MAKVIGVYDSPDAAREAIARLSAAGIDASRLSIIGGGDAGRGSHWKKSLVWGGAAGAAVSMLLPGGGHLLFAGHLAHAITAHSLGLTAKAIVAGATVSGATDLLRHAGLDRRAVKEAAETIAAGRYALALESDWVTMQGARAALGRERQQPDPRLLELVRRHGYEPQSFLSLYSGMKVWSVCEPEAAVVYRQVGRVAVVAAAPLAAREHLAEITRRFLAYCDDEDLDCLMLPVGAEFAKIARSCGMALLAVGESGYFKLPEWKPAGDRAKKVRAGVNQARKAGVRVERYDPAQSQGAQTRVEIESLCQAWVDTREVDALGWLLELDPFSLSEHKRYFLARGAEGKLAGMLACSPISARRGWYLEDLIRHPHAERGVSELLVVEAIRHLAAEGAELATLATSPLAGIESDELTGSFKHLARALTLIYEHLDAFYHFKALHRFKSKFAPSFVEPEFVAIYPPRIRLRMIYAVLGALDPAGLPGILASKLRRVWRNPETRRSIQSGEVG